MPLSAATPPAGGNADPSNWSSASEKNASHVISSTSNKASSSGFTVFPASSKPISAPSLKQRSCVVCRTRKVRCDRLSPCSNCRRANIACISPSSDRPPRWARHLKRATNITASDAQKSQHPDPAAALVMERVRNLESLVNELRGQLEQANTAANSAASGSSGVNSPESSSHDHDADHQRDTSPGTVASSVQGQFGRLVLQDANRSRYVSSGFWSRVNDEVCRPAMFELAS